MDFLNNAFSQLGDLFRSMTPGARITAGLLLVVVVVSLGYLFTARVSSPDTDLMNGVPVAASYLPAMEAAFENAGLHNYEIRGTHISVPWGKKSAYMAALADAKALPPNINEVFDEALENTGAFTTTREREERLKIAKEKKLGLIISLMNGIEAAYVMYDTELKRGFKKEKITTATATAKAAGAVQLEESQVSAIRHLVAGAIAGLKPENVTVADLNGGQIHYGGGENGGSGLDDNYIVRKQIHEQRWTAKILNALSKIPGITVTTNVELDPQQVNRSQSVKYDPKAVAVRQSEEASSLSREGTGMAGRPGYVAQQPNTAAALAGSRSSGTREEEEDSKSETYSLANTERTELDTVGLTPDRVAVSIGVPSSYFEKVWREQNPVEEGQEPQAPDPTQLKSIQQEVETAITDTVTTLLPPLADENEMAKLVTVKVFKDIKPAEIPSPGIGENAVTWLGEYWHTLGMVGLAMFSLMMLRSMVRAGPAVAEPPAGMRVHDEEEEEETPEEAILRRFGGSGRSLRDELADLVQEDPNAAANILKTWIGNVS